jgi:hypothetical protein
MFLPTHLITHRFTKKEHFEVLQSLRAVKKQQRKELRRMIPIIH